MELFSEREFKYSLSIVVPMIVDEGRFPHA